MTKNQFMALCKKLSARMPEFNVHDTFIYLNPVGRILRGIHFDSSRWSKDAFYPAAFVQPLYVPRETLNLGYGIRLSRLGSSNIWERSIPDVEVELIDAIKREAVPIFERSKSPQDLTKLSMMQPDGDKASVEFIYSLIAAGEIANGIHWLSKKNRGYDESIEWHRAEKARNQKLLDLCTIDPIAAQELLLQWERETKECLLKPA
jgi:hypothetical protein